MRRPWLYSRRLLAILLVLAVVGSVAVAQEERQRGPSVSATPYKALAPGLEYRRDTRANGPLSIHVLRIDRIKH